MGSEGGGQYISDAVEPGYAVIRKDIDDEIVLIKNLGMPAGEGHPLAALLPELYGDLRQHLWAPPIQAVHILVLQWLWGWKVTFLKSNHILERGQEVGKTKCGRCWKGQEHMSSIKLKCTCNIGRAQHSRAMKVPYGGGGREGAEVRFQSLACHGQCCGAGGGGG